MNVSSAEKVSVGGISVDVPATGSSIDGRLNLQFSTDNGEYLDFDMDLRNACYLASLLLGVVRELHLEQFVQFDGTKILR